MLLGTDELTILRGSKFYGTWQWINSVTGEPEDFAGLGASIKIKNIHEEFAGIKNTFEIGTATVEPLDVDSNPFKGRVDITLSKEDTLNFTIPEGEDDRYGESDFYAILEILLSTGEVILQAKVRVVESLESETLNYLIDERSEAVIINGKLDNILLRNDEFISLRDNLIDVVIPTAIETHTDNMNEYNQNHSDKLDIYNSNHNEKIQVLNDATASITADKNAVLDAKQEVQTNKDSVASMKTDIENLSEQISQDASDALASKNAAKTSEDNAKESEEIAIAKANAILNLSVEIETLESNEEATSSYNATTGILNIGVPKGDKGNSFVYSDFTPEQLELLKGTDGVDGQDGKSAYEVAVNNGFIGTESQWLESLTSNITESNIPNLPISKITNLDTALNDKLNTSDTVDSLVSNEVAKPLSAKQGKVLKDLIDNINTLLSSDDTALDEMQEIVNYIKQNKTELQNLDLSNIAETTTLKHFTEVLKAKLDGIAENANNFTYAHPSSHNASMINESTTQRFVSDAEKTNWNNKQDILESGTNIKTINNIGILGAGNIEVSSSPTGTIIVFGNSTAPTGYLKCNGALVSRTTYSALFSIIGTTFGAGDGSTTFALPDLRAYFPRGFDDGRGIDTDRVFGSNQADTYLNHSHSGSTDSQGNHSHFVANGGNGSYDYGINIQNSVGGIDKGRDSTVNTSTAGAHTHTVTVGTSTTGGTETRPKNIALLYCIKY